MLRINEQALFIFSLLISINLNAQTDVSGVVSGTWSSTNNPYYLTGQCTVNVGNTLIIQNGVQIYFKGDYF